MRTARRAILAGVGAAAVVASAGLALANAQAVHLLTYTIPRGVAQIRYTGKNLPEISSAPEPLAFGYYGSNWPFENPNRISAELDQDVDNLLRQTVATPFLSPNSSRAFWISCSNKPLSSTQYGMVPMFSDYSRNCTDVKGISTPSSDAQPTFVSAVSGTCPPEEGDTLGISTIGPPVYDLFGAMEVKIKQAKFGRLSRFGQSFMD